MMKSRIQATLFPVISKERQKKLSRKIKPGDPIEYENTSKLCNSFLRDMLEHGVLTPGNFKILMEGLNLVARTETERVNKELAEVKRDILKRELDDNGSVPVEDPNDL